MTPSRTIRALAQADVAALQQLDRAAHGEPWSQRTFLDEIERSDRVHLVAETDAGLVGHASVWIDGPSCRLTNVAVASEHAGEGHASALLLSVLQHALAHSPIANVQLEVRPGNRRAQRLYNRFGFMPVGIERSFYDRSDEHGSRDAVVMAVPDVCADSWRERLDRIAAEQADAEAAA